MSAITTPTELEALPVGTVVLDVKEWSWTKVDDTEREDEDGPLRAAWACVAWKQDRTEWEMFHDTQGIGESVGPFTVLWTPTTTSGADR
jgi:hypothetical protein